jgi:hypothetical protein
MSGGALSMPGGQRYEVRRWICGARQWTSPRFFALETAKTYAALEASRRDINVTTVEVFDLNFGKAIATWVYGLQVKS